MLRETFPVMSVSQPAGPTGQKQGPERVREMEAKGRLCGEADRAHPLFLEAPVTLNQEHRWHGISVESGEKGTFGLTEV